VDGGYQHNSFFWGVVLLLLLVPYLLETNITDPSHQLVFVYFLEGEAAITWYILFCICFLKLNLKLESRCFDSRDNDVHLRLLVVPNESSVHFNHGRWVELE
jgi:hypothetical protein